MKKILFFLNENAVGGAERMTISIAAMLNRARFDSIFVLIGNGENKAIRENIPSGYRVEEIRIKKVTDFLTLRLTFLIRSEKPDFVFSSLMYLNVRTVIAAKLSGTGCSSIIRNDSMLAYAPWHLRIAVNLFYRYAYKIIAQQEEMGSELKTLLGSRADLVTVIHNPLDTSRIIKCLKGSCSPYDSNSVNIVNVASIYKIKGQDILLRGFKIFHDSVFNSHLYIVGRISDEKYYKTLVDYIERNGLENFVHFVGYTDNPYPWIKYSDCFVLSSRLEGLPNALIEASYLKVPAVSTKCVPIVSRIVSDGSNGFLCDVDDAMGMSVCIENAIKLRNIEMTYIPASAMDFEKLFN